MRLAVSAVLVALATMVAFVALRETLSDEDSVARAPQRADEQPSLADSSNWDELRIAREDWPIAFESPPPGPILKKLIARDIGATFGSFEYATVKTRKTPGRADVDGESVSIEEFLHLGNNANYLVSAPILATDFGDIVSLQGVRHLLVTRTLAQAYADSWGITTEGTRAFELLEAFLVRVNAIVPSDLTDEEVKALFHRHTTSRMSLEALRNNAVGLSTLIVERPSLLACEPTDLGIVGCRAVVFLKSTGQRHSEIWLAYDDKHWSLFIGL